MLKNQPKTDALNINLNADLSSITTLNTIAYSRIKINLENKYQLNDLSKRIRDKRFVILGSGSNILFSDDYDGVVVVNKLKGIKKVGEENNHILISVAAGEIWHDLVVSLHHQKIYGLENLALIPGTVGASPVQNIGAYGVEVASFVDSVNVYDIFLEKFIEIANLECGFSYRYSFFKNLSWQKKYIITSVKLKLPKIFNPVLSYEGLCEPNLPKTSKELLNRVISLRQKKLPDPKRLPNAGSFFKNPFISRSKLTNLTYNYPEIPYFDIDKECVKISAAWLIQRAGFKGIRNHNGAGVYENHSLILVNYGNAYGQDIFNLASEIIISIEQMFGITLEPEVRIIPLTNLAKGKQCI